VVHLLDIFLWKSFEKICMHIRTSAKKKHAHLCQSACSQWERVVSSQQERGYLLERKLKLEGDKADHTKTGGAKRWRTQGEGESCARAGV
jgi:hypothetical protein